MNTINPLSSGVPRRTEGQDTLSTRPSVLIDGDGRGIRMGDRRAAVHRAKAAGPTVQGRAGPPVAGRRATGQPLRVQGHVAQSGTAGSHRAFGHIDYILVARPGERGLHVSESPSQLVTPLNPGLLTSDPRS